MRTTTKERVLLVDDEQQILLALEDLLGDLYTIFKSETPERALDLVREDREIAVVITDQRMPTMNGDEFLRKISRDSQALRIMVSGFADLPAVLRAVNDGKVYAYVTKPWDEGDLRNKVQTAVEHFRLTKQLDHERRLLRDLMENCPDGIYFKDSDLRFLRANEPFARLLGRRTTDELVGLRLSDVLSTHDQANALEAEEQAILRDRRPVQDVIRRYHQVGKAHFTSETKAPICDPAGAPVGLVGISRDVTERVETSEALRESESALQDQTRILNSILDGMGDGVVVTARDGRMLIFNREASRILGVPARDVPVEAWPETYGLYSTNGQTLLSADNNPLVSAINGEPLVHVELCIKNSVIVGSIVAITATPLKGPSGAVNGAIALLRDVTQQRSLEQQLSQAQKMEAIGRLAGGVAHDFNNILTVITGCCDLALEERPDEGESRQNISDVLAAARRGTLLTQQLLAFSRRQIIEPKRLQLNEVVTTIESMLVRLIGGGIQISTVLKPDLGLVTADQSQLEQILLNLTINARDAMPDGGVLRIETDEVSLDERGAAELGVSPGRFVTLTVTDTGQGMTEETRQRLFEPFFTTKEIGKGTGLGLATVYGIVRQSKGHVRVLSAPGEGTEFRILMPRSGRDELGNSRTPPPAVTPPITATILLLEEENAVRQIAARILRSEGHVVFEASHPNDALALAAAHGDRIDLLLADIGLLEANGTGFLGLFSSTWPNIRRAYMSGGGPIVGSDTTSKLGDSILIAKPFARSQLLEKVQAAVLGKTSADPTSHE